MYGQFCTRYEEGLAKIAKSITTKGGVKKYGRVNRRIGRLKEKYPSTQRLYEIHPEKNGKDVCTGMTREKIPQAALDRENTCGVCFLRTSIDQASETLAWTVYNCIREIEKSFRTLKTDPDLRPICHRTDEASQAHLHPGLMACRAVNNVRHQLRDQGVTSDWREPVRIMNTRKCVTTTMVNDRKQTISIRCRSKPEPRVALLYDALKLKPAPFIRKKSVVPKNENAHHPKIDLQRDTG
jgi:hypothetical protein